MSVSKNRSLVKLVQKHIADGVERREILPTPGSRFHKLGTIFSRTTGLIKCGGISRDDIPLWYSVYKTFPPKYEPVFSRPPLNVNVKDIYYPEDKLRAKVKRWDSFDLSSTVPNASQKLVANFRERRTGSNDDALIKELLKEQHEDSSAIYNKEHHDIVSQAFAT